MKNNQGFGLIEMLIIMFSALLCLVVCVISYNKYFDEDKEETTELPSLTDENENTDNVSDYYEETEETLTKQEKKYKVLEDKMINGAKIYITNNYTVLNDQIIITVNKLIEEEYIKELIDPNNQKNKCNGYVVFKDNNYIPYLNCEGNYKSEGYNADFE
jgi:Tfp pilus assembly protein PilE